MTFLKWSFIKIFQITIQNDPKRSKWSKTIQMIQNDKRWFMWGSDMFSRFDVFWTQTNKRTIRSQLHKRIAQWCLKVHRNKINWIWSKLEKEILSNLKGVINKNLLKIIFIIRKKYWHKTLSKVHEHSTSYVIVL